MKENIMENLRVIRVEVIAPEKPLDINTFPKNNPNVDFTISSYSNILKFKLEILCLNQRQV